MPDPSRTPETGPRTGATPPSAHDPPTWKLLAAFATVYLVWGSTYLAIRFAVETIPPFLMAGVRFVVAGGCLYGWARLRGSPRPSGDETFHAAVAGLLLLLGGNGAVVWAEQFIPSGLTALLVSTVPLWMVLIDWLFADGLRPGPWLVFGLVWGLFGVGLLVGTEGLGGSGARGLQGALVVLAGSLSWAAGSIWSRRSRLPATPRMSTAVQMLTGGLLLLLLGLAVGELPALDPGEVTALSLLSLLYLIVFGAVLGYSAYIWLLRNTTPARASTYAYVNPLVALLLGWALADEPLVPRTALAAFVILSAVMLITVRSGVRRRKRPPAGSRSSHTPEAPG